ncbi:MULTISPECIES: ATP-binding cassette domain-containing protein [unclassified Campylobacter]|uniref:ATP-binding cassette domain-containing protein n=1 Tax=unclassified Campylobacter TaxID=2593542 RepID=UPI003D3461F4
MRQITYRGIKTNNLKNLNINIIPNSLTCICGCSGSGKSSLAFDTIHAISKSEINSLVNDDYENFNYVVDFYDNILFSVALKQLNFNINPKSSILSYFHLSNELNLLVSSLSKQYTKNAISLSPKNICPRCLGNGFTKEIDINKIIDTNIKLKDNPFIPWLNSYKDFYTQILNSYINDIGINANLKFHELSKTAQYDLLYKTSINKYKIIYKIGTKTRVKTDFYKGIMLCNAIDISEQYIKHVVCEKCKGTRLNQSINDIKIFNYSLQDILLSSFNDLSKIFKSFSIKNTNYTLKKLDAFVTECIKLGLGHLNFSRSIPTLSGGELQRLRIAKIFIANINNIMIVLDEPTSSLHPDEIQNLVKEIQKLKHNNTIVAVEHNKELISKSDYAFYIGLKSGKEGGSLISKKEYDLSQYFELKKVNFKVSDSQNIKLQNLSFLNFKGELVINHNRLIGISSKSGVGKTSLLRNILPMHLNSYQYISQKPIKANINSTIGTYSGIFDDIKKLFALTSCDKDYFCKNKNIICKNCNGNGKVLVLEKYKNKFYDICSYCNGSGFDKKFLKFKVFGMNINEIVNLNIEELKYFNFSEKINKKILLLDELGLSHLCLNRSILNISGGEQQRLKLFKSLSDNNSKIFGLDEPTKGLGDKDILKIISLLYKSIKNENKTFIVAEHNPLFLSYCNDIIEMKRDGNVVKIIFNSSIEKIKNCKESEISKFILI